MTRGFLAAALLAAVSPAALAQQPSTAPVAKDPAPKADLVPVAIETSAGRIVIELDRGRAPLTTANFLSYVDSGKFDGESFYRAMPYGNGGLIQGGIRTDARKLGKPVAFESTDQTGIHNVAGTIAMAAPAPGKAQTDFFIMTTDVPGFDGPKGYAAFGHVIAGMDVVEKILASPVSPTKGDGAMKGQMLDPPVKILEMERVKRSED